MPSYKLTYFDARGRAEACRYLFLLAKVDFDDHRIPLEDWPKVKPTTPFGMVPVLEVDGVQLGASTAIARYLGEQFGFSPESSIDRARGDMIVDAANDLLVLTLPFVEEITKETKDQVLKKVTEEKAPALLANFEKVLKQNKGGDGFFIGDKVTWVDLYAVTHIVEVTKFIKAVGGELTLTAYPKLTALIARVEAMPEIKAFIKKHPAVDLWVGGLQNMKYK